MKLHYTIITTSLLLSVMLLFLTGLYTTWYWWFLLIPFYIGFHAGILICYVLFIAIYSFFLKIFTKNDQTPKPRKFYYGIVRETAIVLLILSRVKIHKKNTELLPKKERFLYIANHQSNFDPMIAFASVHNNPLICVTKPENLEIPVAGNWIRYGGFIPINRENNVEAVKSIILASKYIKNDLASIAIYPEGKRNYDDELLPFHAGSFKIAYKSQAPIAIVSVKNTKQIKNRWPRKTHVYFNVLKVLNYEDYKDKTTTEIAEYARNLIQEDQMVKEAK